LTGAYKVKYICLMSERSVSVHGGIFWRDEALRSEACDVAAELEELGFSGLWLSAGFGHGLPSVFAELIAATSEMTVAAGILSIWHATAGVAAQAFADLEGAHPGRFLLGLGTSHPTSLEGTGIEYQKPYSRMVDYLDDLDAGALAVPAERRILAALGPRMLKLAGERACGAHPYFVPLEHTEMARKILGTGPFLAPEQAVLLEPDPSVARDVARRHMEYYLAQPNYTNNLKRFGFDEADFAQGGSDRLVDALVAWGDLGEVAARVRAHHAAGADTVVVQVLTSEPNDFARAQYRDLAAALL
jgi:probable F420-dependent oxidoreductase